MGISPQPSGDFWRTSAMISSFGSPETNRVRRNAANSAVFSTIGTVVYGDSTCWLGREESNLRMAESKSAALPLGYAPTLHRRIRAEAPDAAGGPERRRVTRSTSAPIYRGT